MPEIHRALFDHFLIAIPRLRTDNEDVTEIPPPIPPAAPTPREIQQQLMTARIAGKKIHRAASVATADAWTIAVFAGLSFVCGLSGGVTGVVMGVAMGIIAYVEFTGASRLRRLDPAAARVLGYNQFALAGAIIIYALWSLHQAANGSGLMAGLNAYQSGMIEGEQVKHIAHLITEAVYGGLIVISIAAQGGTAWYYFSREKYLHRYLAQTPPWIIEMERSGGGIGL